MQTTIYTFATLGLAGQHQRQNASLAIYLATYFLKAKGVPKYELQMFDTFVKPLEQVRWPGRCQTVADPFHEGLTWFLDGAHTRESLECCVAWFADPDVALRDTEDS